jgi:acyl-CoA thioester hydrolase
MPTIHTRALQVPPEAIDGNGHVGNLEYLRWMQEIAIEHSAAQGWPMERYFREQVGWVVRSHFIEYLRPTFEGDHLSLHTWLTSMDRSRTVRRYLLVGEKDRRLVAKAETVWAFVDFRTGRVQHVPDELRAAFQLICDEAARAELGIG